MLRHGQRRACCLGEGNLANLISVLWPFDSSSVYLLSPLRAPSRSLVLGTRMRNCRRSPSSASSTGKHQTPCAWRAFVQTSTPWLVAAQSSWHLKGERSMGAFVLQLSYKIGKFTQVAQMCPIPTVCLGDLGAMWSRRCTCCSYMVIILECVLILISRL